MEISNNTFIELKNNSTIKTILTDNQIVRSGLGSNIIWNTFDLELCAYQKEFIKRILQIKENDNMKTFNDSTLAAYAPLTSSISSTTETTPKTIKILDLWRKRNYECLSDAYDKIAEELYKSDSLYESLLELSHQIADKIVKEHSFITEAKNKTVADVGSEIIDNIGVDLPIHTKKTSDNVTSEYGKCLNAKHDITLRYEEIKTMLSACDTYEQEMSVLKNYGVIDDNGKLNVSTV